MATEDPNTLVSNARIKIIDLVTEGPSTIFWPQSGISGSNPLAAIYFNGVPIINGDGSPNFNISGQGFNFSWTGGSPTQTAMTGFDKVEALIPLPLNTAVTNPPPNAAFPNINGGYPKSVVTSFNTTMFPDAEGIKITLRFPAVYTVNQENGNTNGFDITWAIDVSLNNGPFVAIEPPESNIVEYNLASIAPSPKCTSPYYWTRIFPLPKTNPPASYYEWKIRVRRVSQTVLLTNTQNSMFVDSMAVVSSNQYRNPMSAMVGIELSADQFGDVPVRAIDTKGIDVLIPDNYTPTQFNIHVIDGVFDVDVGDQNVDPVVNTLASVQDIFVGATVQGAGIPDGTTVTFVDKTGPAFYFSVSANPTGTNHGTTLTISNPWVDQIFPAVYDGIWLGGLNTRKWTNNPAWIFYDLCTNKRYGLGRYVRAEWVDKWTLYQIAQFCDDMVDDGDGGLEPRFTCNVAIQQPQDAYTLLNNLVSVFRGMLYWANGRIFPVGSETKDPVFNFSNSNVVNGVFTYSDTPRNTRSTVCIIKWTDPSNMFRTTPERVEDTAGIARFGYVEKQITAFATTSRGQAIRAANWILTVEQLLTETIAFQTDVEGLYLRPGDVFNVYDNFRNNQQQGGRILDFSTGHEFLHLDRNVKVEPGFTYFASALVPADNIANPDYITGSNQIGFIRNAQIETRRVITVPTSSTPYITVDSGFSSALYKGSVWLLNASGSNVTVFDQATQYRVLTLSEPSPGIVEVAALKYNTGINFYVNNNYSVVTNPPIVGDTTPPLPPTGLEIILTTGLDIRNTFYAYTYIYWNPSPSSNTSYYTLTGKIGTDIFLIGQPTTTGINFTPSAYGNYTFSVAANNANGYQSPFCTTDYLIPSTNPLGTTAPLAGVSLANTYDVSYVRPSDGRYTGYVGTAPYIQWNVVVDDNGNQTPTAQFITGYRGRLLKLNDTSIVLNNSDWFFSGIGNNTWLWNDDYLYTGTAIKPLRGFTISIDTLDQFGNTSPGARLAVSNPQPLPPIASGFVGFNGGIIYNVTPNPQPYANKVVQNPIDGSRTVIPFTELSGIYLWCNQSPTFVPNYSNVQFKSTNFGGSAQIAPTTGSFFTWFSLVDTYGFSGSLAANGDYNAPIYGPISGNSNQVVGELFVDITDRLTGAFGYLTGALTQLQGQIDSTGSQLLFMVYGLSGSITGAGAISTALNVTLQTAVVSLSGVQSSQINAVSARLVTTGSNNYALAGTIMDALATTGGALSAWNQQLGAQTTGQNAQINIVAQSFVTGSVNGLGGAAVARYGFKLDANGKVVTMEATSSSFGGASYGTIVFGGADLQSNTYTPGSDGWIIKANGDVEFGNGVFRGWFTGGSATSLIGIAPNGFTVGNPSAARLFVNSSSAGGRATIYNSSNNAAAVLGTTSIGIANPGSLLINNSAGVQTAAIFGAGPADNGGHVALYDNGANVKITLNGQDGSSSFAGQMDLIGSPAIHWTADSSVSISEQYGINLSGNATHPIHIRGGSLVRAGTAGGNFGTQNLLNFVIDYNPDTSWSDSILPNTFECATVGGSDHAFSTYLKLRGPGGTTVYVPYMTAAP